MTKRISFQVRNSDIKKWYSDYFLKVILSNFSVLVDNGDPDYVFHEAHHIDVINFKCLRIAFAAENVRIDFNISDYGIGFDHLEFKDRYLRYPLYLLYTDSIQKVEARPLNIKAFNFEKLNSRKFCNFLVSNGSGSEFRTQFFHLLSDHKKVDSGGRYLNTIGYFVSDKLKWQEEYKFSLCFENSSTSGYLTEKLIEAYAANTVPIYWGDPDAFGYLSEGKGGINPKAVILVDSANPEQSVLEIMKVDSDPELYFSYLQEPLFLDLDHSLIFKDNLERFLFNIFNQPFENSYRRGFGLARNRIENRMKARSSFFLSIVSFIKKRLRF